MKIKTPDYVKRSMYILGSALALLGIIFVVRRLHAYSASLHLSQFNGMQWSLLLGLALGYGAGMIMFSQAWRNLLAQWGVRVSRLWSIRVYGISQLAKYVPGNIFHLAGRQTMGMAAGIRGRVLAKSMFWELGLQVFAGGLLGCLAAPLLWPNLSMLVSLCVFFIVFIGVVVGLDRVVSRNVSIALLWQMTFLMLSSLIFAGILSLVTGAVVHLSLLSIVCGAYIVAWLAGLIMPGAPAGIGVRELVLMFLLKGLVAEADLLLAVTLGRLVTTSGDVGYFLFSYLLPNQRNAGQRYSQNTLVTTFR